MVAPLAQTLAADDEMSPAAFEVCMERIQMELQKGWASPGEAKELKADARAAYIRYQRRVETDRASQEGEEPSTAGDSEDPELLPQLDRSREAKGVGKAPP